jgi:hypothetical protein
MLALADRAYDASLFLAEVAGTGAQFLIRGKASRSPGVREVLPDGSYLSRIGELDVRIIEADVTVSGADGSRCGDRYRLITTLLDHRRFPAHRLVRLYHERWEIESAYYALRATLLQGRVLRSGDRPGLEQEIWALLTLYQLLRMAMTDAAQSVPGTDPDRASFTVALQTASEQLITAQDIIPRTCPASSAAQSWAPCCPPAGPATAPAPSNAPPPATPAAATTPAPPCPQSSPPSTSPSAPRPPE